MPMKLEEQTWHQVHDYLKRSNGIILPTGSIEQHGPIGLIGTDAICAREISWAAANLVDALVAPELTYAHAPFNMSFPGTISISADLYIQLAAEVMHGLAHHGFARIYIMNGHGANVELLRSSARQVTADIRIKSWWEFDAVNNLRNKLYDSWEGMHATPSEVAITQATHHVVRMPDLPPPEKLSVEYIQTHAGDKHGPPDEHRAEFPDGRVGSHSGLAKASDGADFLRLAANALADDYLEFIA
jgi:creatinine amidohydrolase